MSQLRIRYHVVLAALGSLVLLQVLQAQPKQSASSTSTQSSQASPAKGTSQQTGLDRVKAAFAALSTVPADGFRASNDAIIEAANAIASYANGPGSGIVKTAAGDGVNTATGGGLAGMDASGRMVSSGQAEQVIKLAAEAGTDTFTGGSQAALAESISKLSPDVLKSLSEGNLEALKVVAEDLRKSAADRVGNLADVVQGIAETASGYQNGDKAQVIRGLLGIGSAGVEGASAVGVVQAVAEAGLRAALHAQGLSQEEIDARVDAVKDLATEDALKTLNAGSSSFPLASSTDPIGTINAAVKQALNSVLGGDTDAANAIDEFLASGQAAQVMELAAQKALNTATGDGLAGADSTRDFVASGKTDPQGENLTNPSSNGVTIETEVVPNASNGGIDANVPILIESTLLADSPSGDVSLRVAWQDKGAGSPRRSLLDKLFDGLQIASKVAQSIEQARQQSQIPPRAPAAGSSKVSNSSSNPGICGPGYKINPGAIAAMQAPYDFSSHQIPPWRDPKYGPLDSTGRVAWCIPAKN